MLASSGETGEPCGVPAPVGEVTPPSSTPIRSQARISFSIGRPTTPWFTETRTVSHASIADRLG
ncbi:hypothetical protein GCM10017771_02020 [Streptomyces capitiformicae]|uniref:Uncharacterized protein n=1 Tax=Streptomyces capitiformicae TaxID=2014920 RepID=A0A919L243_9ACTN|nr:hypothetical protein GCM10017771_02020 [Streptomyces capitiformicae]